MNLSTTNSNIERRCLHDLLKWKTFLNGVDCEWYKMENIQNRNSEELISEKIGAELCSRINRLKSVGDVLGSPIRNLEALMKQLVAGGKPKKPPSTKIIVRESRPPLIRAMNRIEAASYISLSPSKFDELVKDGRMPPPKRIDGRVMWDIRQIDRHFDELPGGDDEDQNPWDMTP